MYNEFYQALIVDISRYPVKKTTKKNRSPGPGPENGQVIRFYSLLFHQF
jgi:hypothetical protein